jgi:hypothetical protein
MKKLLILLLFVPLVYAAESEIFFQKSLDKTVATVGEPVTVDIYVENRGSTLIQNIKISDGANLPGISYENVRFQSELLPNSSVHVGPFKFIPLVEGNYTLPPAELEFYDPTLGKKVRMKTEEIKLEVVAKSTNVSRSFTVPSDIKNSSKEKLLYPKAVAKSKKIEWAPFSILGVGLLAFLGLLAYAYLKKDRGKAVVMESPKEVTVRERMIEAKSLFYSGDPVGAFNIISEELRRIIRRRYVVREELTNKEYIRLLEERKIDKEVRDKVKHILDFCDLVKFAKHSPTGDEFHDTVYLFEEVEKYFSELPY